MFGSWSVSRTLQFAPNDFDVTLMTDVIEYLPRPGDLLAEIVRVPKPGGVAIITTPNRQNASKWDERTQVLPREKDASGKTD
jgi:SAM-dependent methyltransferase